MSLKEVEEILKERLKGNEQSLAKVIMDYAYPKCFICYQQHIKLHKAFCYTTLYPQLYMFICEGCIHKFRFRRCEKCKVLCDVDRCYCFSYGGIICRYCSQGDPLLFILN